jgi:hypothetical protein
VTALTSPLHRRKSNETDNTNYQDVKGLATELAYEVDDFLTNLGTVSDWDIQFDSKIVEDK